MWQLPGNLLVTKGTGQSLYKLNSFDNALLDAKIANYNHSLQSSIIPPHAHIHHQGHPNHPALVPEGSILPTILSRKHGTLHERIVAALAFGVNIDPALPGLVYELSGNEERAVTIQIATMLQMAADERNWKLDQIQIVTSCLTVTQPFGCAIVAAVLLP